MLGIPVSLLDMAQTMEAIEHALGRRERGWVCTVDAAGLYMAQSDPELARIYRAALVATPDSHGVVWALRHRGAKVAGRVSGIEIADRLVGLSSRKGCRVFLLGAAPGVAEQAAERLRLRHPGCRIVGTRHGYFPPDDDLLVAQEVAQASPDVLLVAMGIPRQEKFIADCLEATGAVIGIGVGGSFDVMSGRVKRAPRWVQAIRCEWLWRLLLNPSKLAKVKLLPKFALAVLREGK